MASIINSTTTAGVTVTGDNSGELQLATNNGTTAVTIDTNQRAAFVAGTAALPAITTTGDTNTGIFFSAADTIDFAEGGTACGQFDSSANFKFNSGYGSVATAFGCRAWVKFNGTTNTGGFCTINGSGGVTSISDDGAGSYTMNFSFTMPDINYSVAGVSSVLIGTSETIIVPNFTPPGTETASTTTSFKFCTIRPSLTTAVDVPFVYLSVFR